MFLKKSVFCCMHINHTALPCRLPFCTPRPPFFSVPPSSPLWFISPYIPDPFLFYPLLHPCLNLLKHRCELTVVISHNATTVLCVTSAQYTLDRSVRGHYESQHLGGADEAQPFRVLPMLSCFILVLHSEFVCTCIHVSKGGFTGLWPPDSLTQHFALCIAGGSVWWPSEYTAQKGRSTVHIESTTCELPSDFSA